MIPMTTVQRYRKLHLVTTESITDLRNEGWDPSEREYLARRLGNLARAWSRLSQSETCPWWKYEAERASSTVRNLADRIGEGSNIIYYSAIYQRY
jgi:hypothetical protein